MQPPMCIRHLAIWVRSIVTMVVMKSWALQTLYHTRTFRQFRQGCHCTVRKIIKIWRPVSTLPPNLSLSQTLLSSSQTTRTPNFTFPCISQLHTQSPLEHSTPKAAPAQESHNHIIYLNPACFKLSEPSKDTILFLPPNPPGCVPDLITK